jgi:hypothetical protein
MANNILLPQQRVNFSTLVNQFPTPLPPRRKLIFHCELISLDNDDATFGIIGYAAWRNGQNQAWTIGTKKEEGVNIKADKDETFPLFPYVAFGNIEIPLTKHAVETVEKDKKDESTQENVKKFFEFVNEITEKKASLADEFLIFKPKLYPNLHSDYNVTVESNGFSAPTNPSPPAPPSEG